MKSIQNGLTFDDLLLVPKRFRGTSRSEISTATNFTKNITLNIPIVSSNMDTVTESEMAIIMARSGGIGVIHRFLPIEKQVKLIKKVKRAQNYIIERPYTLPLSSTIKDVRTIMNLHNVSGILITDENDILKGIITKRDLRFTEDNENDKVESFMTHRDNMVVGNDLMSLDEAKAILKEKKVEKLPLIDKHGIITGLITSVDIERSEQAPKATKDLKGRLRVAAAIGVKDDALERASQLLKADVDALVIDIAHGHSDLAINAVKQLRTEFGDEIDIIAGNVATAEGTADLISAGSSAIKVGVGPGSICITRIVTGSGVPQMTAIFESATVAKEYNIPIIADGGIRTSGDLSKAIAAGSSTVMIGNLLAGTTESPGFPIIKNGRKFKVIRGMASLGASLGRESQERQLKGSFDDNFDDFLEIVPEGVEAMVPFRGSATEVLHQLVGGLRSGISYCGSLSIKEMQEKAEFMRITGAGIRESRSHDVNEV
jgi:IMP dehydrogenase